MKWGSQTQERARKAVAHARAVRDAHAAECTAWDYEGSDCLDCQQADYDLAQAYAKLRSSVHAER